MPPDDDELTLSDELFFDLFDREIPEDYGSAELASFYQDWRADAFAFLYLAASEADADPEKIAYVEEVLARLAVCLADLKRCQENVDRAFAALQVAEREAEQSRIDAARSWGEPTPDELRAMLQQVEKTEGINSKSYKNLLNGVRLFRPECLAYVIDT